jgi:hypothetical protein
MHISIRLYHKYVYITLYNLHDYILINSSLYTNEMFHTIHMYVCVKCSILYICMYVWNAPYYTYVCMCEVLHTKHMYVCMKCSILYICMYVWNAPYYAYVSMYEMIYTIHMYVCLCEMLHNIHMKKNNNKSKWYLSVFLHL